MMSGQGSLLDKGDEGPHKQPIKSHGPPTESCDKEPPTNDTALINDQSHPTPSSTNGLTQDTCKSGQGTTHQNVPSESPGEGNIVPPQSGPSGGPEGNSSVQGGTGSPEGSVGSGVKVEDVALREKSPTDELRPRPHPLSIDTSDSEASLPRYSPKLYTSGDEDGETYPLPSSPSQTPSPSLLEEHAPMSILFSGVTYLGCSSVDAPVSEVEANRKMYTLKTQAASSQPMPVIISIPVSNNGNVILKDPDSEQPLSIFAVKMILFCARGNAEQLLDCFCLNVRHKRSGIYRCHAFRCEIPEACQKIFEAIGKAFKTKPIDRNLPPLSGDTLEFEFSVRVEIAEDDGKGGYSPAAFEKDCFKLKQNVNKKVILTVSQSVQRPIIVERCFGLLISPVQVVKDSEMNLLDDMSCEIPDNHTFKVTGFWDASSHHLAALNQDTKVLGYKYMTIAADLVLESVTEPVRFKREFKASIKPPGGISSIQRSFMSKLNVKKNHEVLVGTSENFRLTLEKCEDGSDSPTMYSVGGISTLGETKEPSRSSFTQMESSVESVGPAVKKSSDTVRTNKEEQSDDEAHTEEDDIILSGWGDVDDTREDLLEDWREMFEEWDGKDKDRPKPAKLIKLCSKGIPRHLRCQVWQMLTGASYDPQLRESYRLLIMKESPAEKVINWDIKRTYVGHEYFQESSGREALYKICKAYSVYDEEVGYCQGFSFMAATLLLQKMPEEEAFGVMVKILFQYGHRELFRSNFQYLHLMFFQLDRLLEEQLSRLFEHFKEHRIETHMFASQWFLTLYTAKFPLSLVFRILDIYLCEGIRVVFRVALGLLKIASNDLLSLDFEGILNYFRVSLPKKFQTEEDATHLFRQMRQFKVSEKKLAKYEKEYQLYLEQQAQLEDPVMRLERENKQLRESVMRLEGENDNLAQELVASKVTLRQEMDRLEERIDTLSKESRAHKTSSDLSQQMHKEVKEELQQAKGEYQRVMVQLMEEKMQHDAAIAEYKQLFQQLDEGHQKEKGELNQELLEVKAQLGQVSSDGSQESSEHKSSLSSEERLRKLELELAQTKLALVESQCKNQELERTVQQLSSSQRSSFNLSIRKKK